MSKIFYIFREKFDICGMVLLSPWDINRIAADHNVLVYQIREWMKYFLGPIYNCMNVDEKRELLKKKTFSHGRPPEHAALHGFVLEYIENNRMLGIAVTYKSIAIAASAEYEEIRLLSPKAIRNRITRIAHHCGYVYRRGTHVA
jgi:hypothetical protein